MSRLLLALCLLLLLTVPLATAQGGLFKRLRELFQVSEETAEAASPILPEVDLIPGGIPQHSLSEEELEALMKKSADLIMEGKGVQSIDSLLSVLESDPDNSEANLVLGTLFLELGRPDQAESFLYKAVKETGWENAIAIVNLMSTLKQNGDPKLAVEVGQSALNAGKLSTEYQSLVSEVIGNTFLHTRDWQKASEWLFFGAMINPGETDNKLWLQASTLSFPAEARDPKVAESVLLEAMKTREKDPELVYYLAIATEMNGNVNEAIVLYTQAIELDHEDNAYTKIPDVWASLGTAFHSVDKLAEADDCYQRGYAINPNNGKMLINWALLSASTGQAERCGQAAREALRILGEDDQDAQRALAGCDA